MAYFFKAQIKSKAVPSPLVKEFSKIIADAKKIETKDSFQKFLKNLLSAIKQNPLTSKTSKKFKNELSQIEISKPLTEKTAWGGVALKKVDVAKNFIQKLLVIEKNGILGFEVHRYKLEKLNVLEGFCLVLFSNHKSKDWQKGEVTVKLAHAGDKFEFLPGDEHGIISLSNCIVEETSTNHLDDLIYIFKADQV